jgi:fructose-1,6-bisphosphatase/inositol monophosphatase family enzyme
VSEESKLRKFIRVALIGSGAMMVVSAATGIYSAYALLEPSDKEAVGLTPGDFVGFYAVMAAIGGGLVFFGLRKKKQKK